MVDFTPVDHDPFLNIEDRRSDPPVDTKVWPTPPGEGENLFLKGGGTMVAFDVNKDFAIPPTNNSLGNALGLDSLQSYSVRLKPVDHDPFHP